MLIVDCADAIKVVLLRPAEYSSDGKKHYKIIIIRLKDSHHIKRVCKTKSHFYFFFFFGKYVVF